MDEEYAQDSALQRAGDGVNEMDGEQDGEGPTEDRRSDASEPKKESPLDILDKLYLEHIHEAFVLAAHPGDKFLETSCLHAALRSLEMEFPQTIIRSFIEACDPQAQGKISEQVFQVLALQLMRARTTYGPIDKGSRADGVLDAFQHFDKENTGLIEEAQLRQAAAVAGHAHRSELEDLLLSAKAAGPAARALRNAQRRASKEMERRASQEAEQKAVEEARLAAEAAALEAEANAPEEKEEAKEGGADDEKPVENSVGEGAPDEAKAEENKEEKASADAPAVSADDADGKTAAPTETAEDAAEPASAGEEAAKESETADAVDITQDTVPDALSDESEQEPACDVERQTQIDYKAFVQLLTRKEHLPTGKPPGSPGALKQEH